MERMKVGERTDSDHCPLEVTVETENKQGDRRERKTEKQKSRTGKQKIQENTKKLKYTNEREEEKPGKMIKLISDIKAAVSKKKVRRQPNNPGVKKWQDRECRESKRKVNGALRKWKIGETEKKVYIQESARQKQL